jgi:hypothetical protein
MQHIIGIESSDFPYIIPHLNKMIYHKTESYKQITTA